MHALFGLRHDCLKYDCIPWIVCNSSRFFHAHRSGDCLACDGTFWTISSACVNEMHLERAPKVLPMCEVAVVEPFEILSGESRLADTMHRIFHPVKCG